MSDLISRKELIRELEKINIGLLTELRHAQGIQDELMEVAIKIQMSAIHTAIEHIKATPTAYDVDKIVERLENNILSNTDGDSDEPCINPCADCENSMWGRAIKIVKAGGVNE